jgi:hypothetical protein
MQTTKTQTLIIALIISISILSCEKKFEKVGWSSSIEPHFPPADREKMLDDLLLNYQLVGMKYSDVTYLLGNPDYADTSHLIYEIVIDYGYDIDPVYTKDLLLFITRDSIIRSIEIKEWKKEE